MTITEQTEVLQFDIMGIQSCQHNRYPMLFIDRITECVPFKYAKGYKLFSYDEWYFPKSFERIPNVPGTILIESLTQVFLMTFLCTGEAKDSPTVSSHFHNVRFYRKIFPGDKLEIEAVCKSFRRGMAKGNVKGYVGGELAVSLDATIIVPKLFLPFQHGGNDTSAKSDTAEVILNAGLCFDVAGIKKCLKNCHPYLYLDRVIDVVLGKSAVGMKNFTYNEWFFPVHFPDDPNVPGFIQIEMCLQAFLMTFLSINEYQGLEAADYTFDNVKLSRKILPGDCLKIEARLENFTGGIAKGRVDSFVSREATCSFDVVIVIEELGKIPPKSKER